jgi:hypothetical protein
LNREHFNKLNAVKEALLAKYFPAVRGAVLLIVVPAFFVVVVYFFSILIEIARGEDYLSVVESEKRLAAIKKDLPDKALVNYVSDRKEPDDAINAEYVLIPVRLVEGRKPRRDLLVYQTPDIAKTRDFEGYTLIKNYGNGVMLFKRIK